MRDEIAETKEFLRGFGIEGEPLDLVVTALAADERRWVDFVMRFELGLERPEPKRAPISALTVAGFYESGHCLTVTDTMIRILLNRNGCNAFATFECKSLTNR